MVVGVWDRIGAQGGAMGVAEWDKDFQGRYKELTPPPPKQHFDGGGASRFSDPDLRSALAGVAGDRLAAAACNGAPSSVVGTTKPLVLMLDLDKCSFFGNDGNDLGIALQWMEKGVEVVEHLYTKLLNPEVGKLYSLITHNYGHHVQPVIYTMRATFLVYHSCFREAVIPLYWKAEWHHGAQIVFPPSVETADDILGTYCGTKQLLEEERVDIKKSLERLLATRTVIRRTLGLTKNPYLVVTAAPKDVSATAQMLGMSDSPSFLWDDNPKLREDPQVVSIPPFVSLPHEAARDLEDWLTTTLPPSELDEYLVEFMLGADERDRVLHRDGNGGTKYVIPRCDSIAPWPLPPALRDTRSDGGDSPVTPVTSGSRSLDSEDEPRQASGAFEEGFQR
ncbi:hypothetical protein T484DRAFT_1963952 [Baffinella frigidus]|nr:hypothetical protein T484DRAFT_1963952 [Cryptophyta sp. CCMP2293]